VSVVGAFTIAGMALMKKTSAGSPPIGERSNGTSHTISPPSSTEPKGVKQFLTSYLPSAGAAAAGVVLGFRKK
jgi:hypothetical protein